MSMFTAVPITYEHPLLPPFPAAVAVVRTALYDGRSHRDSLRDSRISKINSICRTINLPSRRTTSRFRYDRAFHLHKPRRYDHKTMFF